MIELRWRRSDTGLAVVSTQLDFFDLRLSLGNFGRSRRTAPRRLLTFGNTAAIRVVQFGQLPVVAETSRPSGKVASDCY